MWSEEREREQRKQEEIRRKERPERRCKRRWMEWKKEWKGETERKKIEAVANKGNGNSEKKIEGIRKKG